MLTEINNSAPRDFARRRQWLEGILDEAVDKRNSKLADMNLNSKATALLLEAMKLFCSGHWVSSIIMSQATIDAALWDDKGLKGIDTNKLKTSAEYVWLRNKPVSYTHLRAHET